jgi:hypothetical protein
MLLRVMIYRHGGVQSSCLLGDGIGRLRRMTANAKMDVFQYFRPRGGLFHVIRSMTVVSTMAKNMEKRPACRVMDAPPNFPYDGLYYLTYTYTGQEGL